MILHMLMLMPCYAPNDEGGSGGSGAGGSDDADPKLVPVEALRAERKARQELETKLAKLDADRKAAEEKAAADAGEYRKLYEPTKAELDATKAELAKHEAAAAARTERLAARNDARIKALPEAACKAVSALAGKLSAEDLADYLDEHGTTFGADERRPAGTVSNGKKPVEDPIPAEALAEWERHGKRLGQSDRSYYENVWKPRQARRVRK